MRPLSKCQNYHSLGAGSPCLLGSLHTSSQAFLQSVNYKQISCSYLFLDFLIPKIHPGSISSLSAWYPGWIPYVFRTWVSSSDKLREWISWLFLFLPILVWGCFWISFGRCAIVQIAGDFLWLETNSVMYCLWVCIRRMKLNPSGATFRISFHIRTHWPLTWDVISPWTKSTISPFSPVSQSMVGNSDSQLGVFTMWQAQRHFWGQHRGLSNSYEPDAADKISSTCGIWVCVCQLREGWVVQSWGWGW